jgi:nucleoside-diphosphate-sugar epimerase
MSRQRYAVTGVSRGIGTEIAMALRSRGHRVAGFDVAQMVSTTSYISIFRTRRRFISAASKISPLHALIG